LASQRLGILAVYLVGKRLEELSYYRKLSRQGHKLGLQVEVFTPEDVEDRSSVRTMTYNTDTGKWVRKQSTIPPLIYDRCRYHGASTYRILKAFRGKYTKLNYLSKPLANKWSMHQILWENEALRRYVPATVRYSSVTDLIRFLKKYKLVYLKPKNGTGGRGIIRIEQLSGGQYMIQGRNKQRTILPLQRATEKQLTVKLQALSLSSEYVVQQGIYLTLQDGRVHDYRLLIQKNGQGEWEITGCAGRIGPHKSITSNLHGGGRAVSMERLLSIRFSGKEKINKIKQDMYDFAHKLAPYLESKFGKLCELGLDLAVDPKGSVWLIEVNPKPSREVFHRIGEKATYLKAITRPLEYALWLMNDKKSVTENDEESSST
jgi:glutathione synthase/RimK-type ligase-like ATP-grasp enzyme